MGGEGDALGAHRESMMQGLLWPVFGGTRRTKAGQWGLRVLALTLPFPPCCRIVIACNEIWCGFKEGGKTAQWSCEGKKGSERKGC